MNNQETDFQVNTFPQNEQIKLNKIDDRQVYQEVSQPSSLDYPNSNKVNGKP